VRIGSYGLPNKASPILIFLGAGPIHILSRLQLDVKDAKQSLILRPLLIPCHISLLKDSYNLVYKISLKDICSIVRAC
jgi:hypothetical protein